MFSVRVAMAGATGRGSAREVNEDAIGIHGLAVWSNGPGNFPPGANELVVDPSTGSALVCVTDGLGGALGGQMASLLLAQRASQPGVGRNEDLVDRIAGAHDELLSIQAQRPELNGSGAVVAGVVVTPRGIPLCFNVGDVRVYYANAGSLVQASRDDSEKAPFSTTARLTRWVGQAGVDAPEPWIRPLDPVRERRLLICSDGLYSTADDSVIQDILCNAAPTPPGELVSRLMEATQGATDDRTAVVLVVTVSDTDTTAVQQRGWPWPPRSK